MWKDGCNKKKWTLFYFIVVAQQKTKSNYVKFIEKTFIFLETYLETHGQSCISVSSWPWISEEVKGKNKKIERAHCEYYQSKKKFYT